jgi:hypothetical protein
LRTGIVQVSGRGFRVADYRAYTVGRDGHITGFEPLVCADDAEAIEKAKCLIEDMMSSFGVGSAL